MKGQNRDQMRNRGTATIASSWGAAMLGIICVTAFPSTAPVHATTAQDSFFANLFKVYMPRHCCMFEETSLIWLHLISDAVIALAYFSIPIALIKLVRARPDLRFNWMFSCFAIFILACGTGHVLNVIAIWAPVYRVDGVVKLITAIASVTTATLLWPLIPKVVEIPSVTALQLAIEELRHTNERLRLLTESAKEYAIFLLDNDGYIRTWNIGAQRIKGYTAEQIIGKHFSVFFQEAERVSRKPEEELKIALRDGQYTEEGWRVRADGSLFLANVLITAVRDSRGTPLGFSKITRDLTDSKKVEQTILDLNQSLQNQNAQLEYANKELEAFSYSVSHDLRAPLRSIDGFSQAVIEDCGKNVSEQCRQHLQRVRIASQRMGQLIDDLLNLSKVARTPLHKEQTDLTKIAREICEECQTQNPDRNVTAKIAGSIIADVDPRLMRVVLTNLLSNAWKFSSKRPDPVIEFGCTTDSTAPECFVRDNGAGFDMAYVAKLFGAFQRLHSDKDFPGTGIGLATVQRIIHRHGGRVRAESVPGQGATFYFTLGISNGISQHTQSAEV